MDAEIWKLANLSLRWFVRQVIWYILRFAIRNSEKFPNEDEERWCSSKWSQLGEHSQIKKVSEAILLESHCSVFLFRKIDLRMFSYRMLAITFKVSYQIILWCLHDVLSRWAIDTKMVCKKQLVIFLQVTIYLSKKKLIFQLTHRRP